MWRSRRRAAVCRVAPFEYLEARAVFTAADLCAIASPLLELPAWGSPRAEADVSTGVASPSSAFEVTGVYDVQAHYGLRGTGQTVVVIDSGIAYDHFALGAGFGPGHRVVGGWDFSIENDADPYDDGPAGFHGTHVAGIIGSDDPGHLGVAPGVDLVALRVFDDRGNGDLGRIEKALTWVATHIDAFANPITTVNLSLGTRWNGESIPSWATLEDELQRLHDLGLFVAVAAGNDFSDFGQQPGLSYPAASPYVVPVASTNLAGQLSEFSQRATNAIAAPGEQITSTVPDYLADFDGRVDDFGTSSGTSMATPFVAGASVLIREALQLAGDPQVTQQEILDVMRQTADLGQDEVTGITFSRLNVAAAIRSILPEGEFTADDSTARTEVSWGVLDREGRYTVTAPDSEIYRLTVPGRGAVRLTLAPAPANPSLAFTVRNAAGDVLGQSRPEGSRGAVAEIRLDAPKAENNAGGDIFVEINSAAGGSSLLVEQIVAIVDDRIQVFGTAGDDQIGLALSGHLIVNDFAYDFRNESPREITIDAGPGQDQVNLHGTAATETIKMEPGAATITGTGLSVFVSHAERINATSGGGADRVEFVGSAQIDQFFAKDEFSWMRGTGYLNYARGFGNVVAHAEGPGDEASFYGSLAADRVVMRPHDTLWQSDGRSQRAAGFDVSYAYGTGAEDRAYLYDSEGDDRLTLNPTGGWIIGPGYANYIASFGAVEARASAGHDVARLFDSPGSDRFFATPTYSRLSGNQFVQELFGFSWIEAFSQGGADHAELIGSVDADRFIGKTTHSWIKGPGYLNYVRGFPSILVDGRGGSDEARLVGSSQDDQALFAPLEVAFTAAGNQWQLLAIPSIVVESQGGRDAATYQASEGTELWHISDRVTALSGSNYWYTTIGFSRISARTESRPDPIEASVKRDQTPDLLPSNPFLQQATMAIDQLAATGQLAETASTIVPDCLEVLGGSCGGEACG